MTFIIVSLRKRFSPSFSVCVYWHGKKLRIYILFPYRRECSLLLSLSLVLCNPPPPSPAHTVARLNLVHFINLRSNIPYLVYLYSLGPSLIRSALNQGFIVNFYFITVINLITHPLLFLQYFSTDCHETQYSRPHSGNNIFFFSS